MHSPEVKEVSLVLNTKQLSVLPVNDGHAWFEKARSVFTNGTCTKINIVVTQKEFPDNYSNCLYHPYFFTGSDLHGPDITMPDVKNPVNYKMLEQLVKEREIPTSDIVTGRYPLPDKISSSIIYKVMCSRKDERC